MQFVHIEASQDNMHSRKQRRKILHYRQLSGMLCDNYLVSILKPSLISHLSQTREDDHKLNIY